MRLCKMRTETDIAITPSNTQISSVDTDAEKLAILTKCTGNLTVENILIALKKDKVVLIRDLSSEGADELMASVADALQLRDDLEIQAGFASIQGHRQNVGRYYMTVNKRENYEIVTPHSEGRSSVNIQIASFYCYENSTNGGESILFNVDNESPSWLQQREQIVKAKITKSSISATEIAQAKALFRLDLEKDLLRRDDEILNFMKYWRPQEKPTQKYSIRTFMHIGIRLAVSTKIRQRSIFAY